MESGRLMKDNQGFTLIEFIIIIVIVSLLSIGSMLGADMLGYGKTKSTISKIDEMLDFVQMENMTKNDISYLVISEDSGNYFLSVMRKDGSNWISKTHEKLKLKKGEINIKNKDGSGYLISGSDVVGREERSRCEISFSKETGGILRNDMGEVISEISVKGGGISYTINLVEVTGKHYIE